MKPGLYRDARTDRYDWLSHMYLFRSFVDTGSTFSCRGSESTVCLFLEFEVEGVSPVDGVRLIHEPEVGIDEPKDEQSPPQQEPGVLVVEFVVQVGHFVGVLLGVVLVGSVENEPFAELEHGGHPVDVLSEGQLEVLGVDQCSFPELLVPGQSP